MYNINDVDILRKFTYYVHENIPKSKWNGLMCQYVCTFVIHRHILKRKGGVSRCWVYSLLRVQPDSDVKVSVQQKASQIFYPCSRLQLFYLENGEESFFCTRRSNKRATSHPIEDYYLLYTGTPGNWAYDRQKRIFFCHSDSFSITICLYKFWPKRNPAVL